MGFKAILFQTLFLLNLTFSPVNAEVLKTINVSMPSNYGTFFGEIHYSDKDLILALRLERIIKEDLIKVINYFEYVPYDIVHFNIDPYMRLTNGDASIFPTNIINLYNFPASNKDHLITMENWLQGLVLHEFVHITHLDQTRDYLQVGRQIFGTIAKLPSGIVPRWFTEGIAVWGESNLINGGRLNNPLFTKELLLFLKKEESCKTIDCLDKPGNYPNGELAYWAGANFIEYLENIKPKTIKCLVEFNSASLPFFLNDAFLFCSGRTAQDLFQKFRENFILNSLKTSPLKIQWGEKIINIFGSDNFQKGQVLDTDRVFKVENTKTSEALVAYDLKDQVHFFNQYNAPISDVSSIFDYDNENKMLLVSFNDDSNFRIHNKIWKLIDPDTLLIEKDLSFSHDPSYVIPLGGDNYISFSYWNNSWQVEENDQVVYKFPSHYNVNLIQKIGDKLILKINDSNGVSSLILSDLKLKKLRVIYKSDNFYDLPLIQEDFLIMREGQELKILEFDKELKLSSLPSKLFENISFVELNQARVLSLEDGLKTSSTTDFDLASYLKKQKSNTKLIVENIFQPIPFPRSSFASERAESYPRPDHLIPHYWFLAFGNSDNINSIGAMTSFADPMNIYSLSSTLLAYPSVSKIGATLNYNQKLIQLTDLWTFSIFAKQDYSKTDFNSALNLSRDLNFRTDYKFLYKKWSYGPGVFAGLSTTEDFISRRTISNLGTSHVFSYNALTNDDLFQSFSSEASFQFNKAEVGNPYLVTRINAEGGWKFSQDLIGTLKGSHSKFYKSDFRRGVVYGGGISNYTKSRTHEFYGLAFGNAFGNEIFNNRVTLDYNFWNIYRGKNLLPFFFKEVHLRLGHDSLFANRIFLDGEILKNKTINSFFVGPRLKMNLFYHVPTDIDLVFSSIAKANGKNINQTEFSLSANLP